MNRGALSALILVAGVVLGLLLARFYPAEREAGDLDAVLKQQGKLLESQARLISALQDERRSAEKHGGEDLVKSSFPGPAPARGGESAGVLIVVFSDFSCRHCAGMAGVLDRVWSTYGEKVRIVFKHNPIAGHPVVREAHRAAVAAFQQDRFWEMQTRLFSSQEDLDSSGLRRHARALGLNMEQFEDDLASAEAGQVVQRDIAQAKKAGVSRVPTLFLDGEKLKAGLSYELLSAVIEKKLAGTASASNPLR